MSLTNTETISDKIIERRTFPVLSRTEKSPDFPEKFREKAAESVGSRALVILHENDKPRGTGQKEYDVIVRRGGFLHLFARPEPVRRNNKNDENIDVR